MPKSKYDTHVKPKLHDIESWAREGVTDKKIAENIGVSYSTFREYVKKYPALSASLKRGKNVIDQKVENALLKRALGYDHEEVKEVYEGNNLVKRTVTKKHTPADVGALIFWLKNRMPDTWKNDYHKVKHDEEVLKIRQKESEMKEW